MDSESPFFAVEDLPADFLRPGTERRSVRLGGLQFMVISFDRVTVSPLHDHTHDSVIFVDRGEFQMTVGGHTKWLCPGEGAKVPAGVRHGLTTDAGSRIIEVWYPLPEDQ